MVELALNLAENIVFLVIITLLEVFLIFIPALISAKIENKSIIEEIKEMGFQGIQKRPMEFIINSFLGLLIGFLLYLLNTFILIPLSQVIIINTLGIDFFENAVNNTINTQPYNPSLIELLILILLQIIIVGPCEEGFFRGFLITKTQNRMKLFYSMLVSSLIFTIYHIPPFLVPITTIITFFGYFFFTGLILASTFIVFKNSIIPCSIAHSFFNILIILI